MDQLSARGSRPLMHDVEVRRVEAKLDVRGWAVFLRRIEGEVQEGTVLPRVSGMDAAGPSVVGTVDRALVIIDVEVDTEPVLVELRRPIDIGYLDDDQDQSVLVHFAPNPRRPTHCNAGYERRHGPEPRAAFAIVPIR